MFNIFLKRRFFSYSAAMNLVYETSIHNLRTRTKILFVDDEELDLVNILKERKYDIYYKNDITYAIEAEAFDIIIIDIVGIGKSLGSTMGGLAVAIDIKKRYPAKQVLCFSGQTNKPEITAKIGEIDGYILKDTDIDQWCEKLDGLIKKYCSKEYQKDVLRRQLEQCQIGDKDIQNILKEYDAGWDKKNFNDTVEKLTALLKNGKQLVEIITTIYTFVSHFVS